MHSDASRECAVTCNDGKALAAMRSHAIARMQSRDEPVAAPFREMRDDHQADGRRAAASVVHPRLIRQAPYPPEMEAPEAGKRHGPQSVDLDLPHLGSRTPPGAGGSHAGAAPWYAPAARQPRGGGREDLGNAASAYGVSSEYARPTQTSIAPMTPWMMPGLRGEGAPRGYVQVSPGGHIGRGVRNLSMDGGGGSANAASVPQMARRRGGGV